jgi:hypothetical protein
MGKPGKDIAPVCNVMLYFTCPGSGGYGMVWIKPIFFPNFAGMNPIYQLFWCSPRDLQGIN